MWRKILESIKNLRNELKKGKKYYFYDNGVRNTILNNFSPLDLRMDKGMLWENYLISERIKKNQYQSNYVNTYFWRTTDGAEIDYIEERDGILNAYEFKWKSNKVRFPNSFLHEYPENTTAIINNENYEEFIL